MTPKELILYGLELSPPVRGVLLTANALDIPIELKIMNLMTGDHKTPEFTKMNPQQCLPTLDDNGFIMWDSHAIIQYLVNQYGCEDDPLYPKEPKKRAIVDQRLHFDSAILDCRLRTMARPIFFHDATAIDPEALARIYEGYALMDAFLEGNQWLNGDGMTIADLSCVSTVSTLDGVISVQEERFPNLSAWLDRCRNIPYYEKVNQPGVDAFKQIFLDKNIELY